MAERRLPGKFLPILVLVVVAVASATYIAHKRKPRELILSGTLEARTVSVGSLVGGRVTRVEVDEGHRLTAGQTLVRLETEPVDRQMAEQQAAIAVARAQLAKAVAGPRDEEIDKAVAVAANDERERRRMKALFDDGIVARQMYDDAATKARTSSEDLQILREGTRREEIAALRAQVEQQERRLATLREQKDESVIRSPVAGVVQSFGLRPGDLVAPNQPVAEILEEGQLWVRVYVPETLLGLVKVNQTVRVRVDTFPETWFRGRVASVSSEGEYTPRNVQTRAQRADQVFGVRVLVDTDPRLKPGMAAEVDLGVKGRA